MTKPSTTRELLIVEALGEAAKLMQQVEALAPALDLSRQALADAHSGLASQLTAFESQILALSEKAKAQAVKHVLARTEEATRRSNSRAGPWPTPPVWPSVPTSAPRCSACSRCRSGQNAAGSRG